MEDGLQQPRLASELYDWVNEKIKTLSRQDLVLSKGPAKIILDELWPITIFAKYSQLRNK
jgi:hypothetical protein